MSRSVFAIRIFLAASAAILAGCSGRATSTPPPSFAGTFEYSDPWPSGYLYYKLDLTQTGNAYAGTLLAGNYRAASPAGGYIDPDILLDCTVEGSVEDGVLTLNITVSKQDKIGEDAPDLQAAMNFPMLDSAVSATAWTFRFENGALTSQNGMGADDPDVLTWTKIAHP